MVQAQKKIALLHRYPRERIKETNAAFPYLAEKGIDVLTFKKFDRLKGKFLKSLAWIFYAPMLVIGKGYDVIYCDDSFPFYPALVKLVSPRSKVVLRLGDFHLMYYTSGIVYKVLHFFERMAWRMADEIIAISEPMQEYIGRGQVVLDSVDPTDFPNYTYKYNSRTVMFHGLLVKNKGVDILIDAAKQLPNVWFKIVGDGPDRARLEAKAPRNVYFKGWVPFRDIHKEIFHCGLGVALRSDNPGNEYVVTSPLLQYGVMGKPCLVTRRKVFGDYPWQFDGPYDLADKIEQMLKAPGQEGQKLREYVLNNHDARKIAEEIWSVLLS